MNLLRSFNYDVDHLISNYGDRTALISAAKDDKKLTYSQLDEIADKYIALMKDHGIHQGSTVGVILPNSLEMLVIFIACLRGGINFAPLACDTTPVEVERWVNLIKPSCFFISSHMDERVKLILQSSEGFCLLINANGSFDLISDAVNAQHHSDGARLYLFSSGTTGAPKAIVLDVNRLWSAGHAFIRYHGASFDESFRIWSYLPHSYLGGLFNMGLIPLSVGGTVVVDSVFSGKTFLEFWQILDRYDINVVWFVPAIVRGLLAIGERTNRQKVAPMRLNINLAFLGTAPIDRATKIKFENLFSLNLIENYALSETTFITSENTSNTCNRTEGGVGKSLPYVELRFKSLPNELDEFSEILVRSPFQMLGYLESDGLLCKADEDGFFPTGDLGFINDTGELILSGRIRDVIKKGGYFIGLREIELLAQNHPAVDEAVTEVIKHPFYGESYRVMLKLKLGVLPSTVDEVRDFIYASLARYKWPDSVDLVNDFPRTASGKIRKFLPETHNE